MKISIELRTMLALLAFLSVLFTSMRAASDCIPVAYLFRHAEDSNSISKPDNHPFDPTLSYSGQAHSDLYIQMMDHFQATQSYCPVTTVYSLNPILPSGGNGTSNPYWTAVPLAQKALLQNPIITIGGTILDEYLRQGSIATKFLDAINVQLTNGQSVAIFWTSQGMCTVATTLGQSLPKNYYLCRRSKTSKELGIYFL